MKRWNRVVFAAIALSLIVPAACAQQPQAQVGKAAPNFTLTDTNGKTHNLSDFKGKYVVLEWLNHGCPYVGKHYNSGNMQKLQKEYTGKGVVWLSIVSSAPGKQGHMPPEEANRVAKEKNAAPTAILIDEKGTVGRMYGAKTTPQMVVITPEGTLVYNGAIDDKPTTEVADIQSANNYLVAALTETMAGKPVSTATTQPYGCSVKY